MNFSARGAFLQQNREPQLGDLQPFAGGEPPFGQGKFALCLQIQPPLLAPERMARKLQKPVLAALQKGQHRVRPLHGKAGKELSHNTGGDGGVQGAKRLQVKAVILKLALQKRRRLGGEAVLILPGEPGRARRRLRKAGVDAPQGGEDVMADEVSGIVVTLVRAVLHMGDGVFT